MAESSVSGRSERVLYLTTSDISARFLRGQLAFMLDHDYSVHVGTNPSPNGAAFDEGVCVHRIAYEREPHLLADVRAFVQTIRLIRQLRPEIVNASTPKAGLLGMAAAWISRTPRRIHVVRGFRFETMTGWKRQVISRLEGLSIRLATDVVFNSASLIDVAERNGLIAAGCGQLLGGGSGNGVDIERFHDRFDTGACRSELGLEGDGSVIGFIGRLTVDKGVPDLIRAFDIVTDRVPGVQLVVIGDYELGNPVPERVRDRIAFDPAIIHRRWTESPERVYPAFDVIAFPSRREGLPNVVIEAQAAGVPVAGYDVTGTRDAVSNEARRFLVKPGNAELLADRLVELLAKSPQNSELVDQNRRWVAATFAQDRVWNDLLAIYSRR